MTGRLDRRHHEEGDIMCVDYVHHDDVWILYVVLGWTYYWMDCVHHDFVDIVC